MGRGYLAGGVDDFGSVVVVLVFDDAREGVFDGGVVRLDEVTVDELYSEGGFAC